MIGIYDYTVISTYISLLSASFCIVASLNGDVNLLGCVFCLLFCGLCDVFDGKIARRKKNRTKIERKFGIQIDSLSDLIAFGVLPACIGVILIRNSKILNDCFYSSSIKYYIFGVLVLYILAALIRLAYFNVVSEETMLSYNVENGNYIGLPVTTSALIFPIVISIQLITHIDLAIVYIVVLFIIAFLFILKIKIKKPTNKHVFVMILLGIIEFVSLIICKIENLV